MMELEEIKSIWQSYEKKLDRNYQLNLELLRRTNLDKAKSKIRKLTWMTGITLAFYVMVTFFFVVFAIGNSSSIPIAASSGLLALWTLLISIAAVHELELISRLDYGAPVAELQKRLSHLKLVIIRYMRLAVWIFPLYMVFVVMFFKVIFGVDIVAVADTSWLLWQLPVMFLFALGALWAHKKLSPKNAEKPWMNKLLSGNGSQITEALIFLKEIDEFEREV
ncbi:hypothetical protein E1176_08130 [Fulvivirga sp. RKSG066]|uniref:hypothetical protein n=1 Tax=Fulvivirga aurantia TaxID=2529383 RepID=UPI0012BCA4C9|nr:hypothetical protein [Fulvivirga aurantia]MTI20987.1 hypothetical protein [Fulvivirga aurantia]